VALKGYFDGGNQGDSTRYNRVTLARISAESLTLLFSAELIAFKSIKSAELMRFVICQT
jgi:hypothetical protein